MPTTEPLIEIADLVTADLNAAALGFTATREYVPIHQLNNPAKQSNLAVVVLPDSCEEESGTRGSVKLQLRVAVGFFKKLPTGSDGRPGKSEIDSLLATVRRVKDRLAYKIFDEGYSWVQTQNQPLVDPEQMDQHHVFVSRVLITFQTFRAV